MDVGGQLLESAATDLFQLATLRLAGCLPVVVDRDPELAPEPCPEDPGKLDAGRHRQIGKGDERHDVRRTHARVLALMLAQVDAFRRDPGTSEGGIDRPVRLAHERHHHPVMG